MALKLKFDANDDQEAEEFGRRLAEAAERGATDEIKEGTWVETTTGPRRAR